MLTFTKQIAKKHNMGVYFEFFQKIYLFDFEKYYTGSYANDGDWA